MYDHSGQKYAEILSTDSDDKITSITLSIYDKEGNQTDTISQPVYQDGAFTVANSSIKTSQIYDVRGNVTCDIDGLGNKILYTYDESGRLLSVKEGKGTTSYAYSVDTDGNSKVVTTYANGSTSTTLQDGAERTLYTVYLGSGKEIKTSYEYDEEGNLIKQVKADKSYLSYTYDSQNRLKELETYDSNGNIQHSTEYTYDSDGRVIGMSDQKGEHEELSPLRYTGYTYNTFGELVESWEVDGTDRFNEAQKQSHLRSYTYNEDGTCASVSYAFEPNGVKTLNYIYNTNKQLEKITAHLKDGRVRTISEYKYTADGKVASRKDYEDFTGTGEQYIQRNYTYDAFDRVLSMSYNESKNADKKEEEHTYQYDKESHITHEETSLNWKDIIREVKDYTYDEDGQLVKSVLVDQNDVQTTMDYVYDSVGNRLKMTKTLFGQKENKQLKQEETSYTYNGLDQMLTSSVKETKDSSSETTSLATYSYDANGNLVSTTDTVKNEELTYQYDPQGQMISYQAKTDGTLVTTQKNEYNGNGKRILKKDGNQEESYYYQNETLLLTVSDSQLKDFYYLGNVGNPLAVASKTSDGMKSYTYQKDVQGSTRAVTDTDGKCVEWYKYSDFGETTIHEEQAGFENVLCYTGGVYDESSGLYYLNARYYNPEMGRFISRDTYEGKNEEPSSLHLYLYCANDPVNYVDPSGHERKIAVIYYTGYNNGREKEHNGFRVEAYNSPYYDANWSNVKFYKITYGRQIYGIWEKIEKSRATELYMYMHGGLYKGGGRLYFKDSYKSFLEISKIRKKNSFIVLPRCSWRKAEHCLCFMVKN